LESSPGVPYTSTENIYLESSAASARLVIKTHVWQKSSLYIKACSNWGVCNRQSFYVEVCGYETISVTPPSGVPFERVFEINSGTQTETNFCQQMFTNNNEAYCPVTSCVLELSEDGG
jgi:hypothetical protein